LTKEASNLKRAGLFTNAPLKLSGNLAHPENPDIVSNVLTGLQDSQDEQD
jgi:hypothetical protein